VGCSPGPQSAQAEAQPAATAPPPPGPRLVLPLDCQVGVTCEVQNYYDRDPGADVQDYRCGRRAYDGHDGVDFRILDMAAQARGVDVLAAAAGRVTRLRDGVADDGVMAEGQECGNGVVIDHGDGWETQYCHLARGSLRVNAGEQVAAGQPIGRVGYSGATQFPHVHLGVRRQGEMLDPFAPSPLTPGTCAPQASLWTPEAARQLAYKRGAILRTGLAGSAVVEADVDSGAPTPATAQSPVLAAYARFIGLEGGDRLELTLLGPKGEVLATNLLAPLERDKAQYFLMVGRKRPPEGWPGGRYAVVARIHRDGAVAGERRSEGAL
jgi:hypothetical protein